MNAHDFVFVGGLHRSGTTMLASVVAQAHDVSGLERTNVRMDEGQFLQDVYPVGAELGGVTRWALDQRAHMTESDAGSSGVALGERMWESWRPFWDLRARILVEKTPLNLMKTRFLQACFPNTRFVVITRHPLTQALTIQKWFPNHFKRLGFGLRELVEHWVVAHETYRDDEEHLNRAHVLRFEDLARDAESESARLSEFLGFTVPDGLATDPARVASYERRWGRAVSGTRSASSKRLISSVTSKDKMTAVLRDIVEPSVYPRYIEELDERFGERINALGYDLRDLTATMPWVRT